MITWKDLWPVWLLLAALGVGAIYATLTEPSVRPRVPPAAADVQLEVCNDGVFRVECATISTEDYLEPEAPCCHELTIIDGRGRCKTGARVRSVGLDRLAFNPQYRPHDMAGPFWRVGACWYLRPHWEAYLEHQAERQQERRQ